MEKTFALKSFFFVHLKIYRTNFCFFKKRAYPKKNFYPSSSEIKSECYFRIKQGKNVNFTKRTRGLVLIYNRMKNFSNWNAFLIDKVQ